MKRKPRIFVIWARFPPFIGGGAAQGYRIYKALSERGYSVTVFVKKHPGANINEKFSPNFQIVRIPPSLRELSKRWSRSWFLAVVANSVIYCNLYLFLLYFYLKNKPDIILKIGGIWEFDAKILRCMRLGISSIAPWILLKKIAHAPLLVYFCNLLNMSKRYALMSSYSADNVMVVDSWMEHALKEMGVMSGIDYLPVCVDTKVFQPEQNKPMKNVLFVGRLAPETGCDTLIKAAPEIIKNVPDCKITIVGDGREMPVLKEMAERLNIMSHVVFAGPVEPEQTQVAYVGAKVLANPSRVQNIGHVTIEAMSCGIPVVKSLIDGYPNYPIEDGVNGYSFKMDDRQELANRVVQVLKHPRWDIMSKAARKTAIGFDIRASVDKLENIIEITIKGVRG